MWFISRWEKNYCLFRSQCIRIIDPYALWPFDKRLLICFPTCFNKEVKYLTLILKKDCSQLSFEVYNVCVPQKLQHSEFLIKFSFCKNPGHLGDLQDCNINFNRVTNFSWRCQFSYQIRFVGLEWKLGGVRIRSPKI